eukprot:TRINITY_DN401_c0_g1_i1.p1 TRINITY_DN401_c0_g1~~TRINITY_DN401_c0_g1_i1.p1  ORF type:complete len:159 (+),score=6.75 TRINITY_DN401_c0_g1_i1:56-532(+)
MSESTTTIFNKKVKHMQAVCRPIQKGDSTFVPPKSVACHGGIVATTEDNQVYLIHKTPEEAKAGNATKVTQAKHMSKKWDKVGYEYTPPSDKKQTVGDVVKAAGPNYSTLFDNCNHAVGKVLPDKTVAVLPFGRKLICPTCRGTGVADGSIRCPKCHS